MNRRGGHTEKALHIRFSRCHTVDQCVCSDESQILSLECRNAAACHNPVPGEIRWPHNLLPCPAVSVDECSPTFVCSFGRCRSTRRCYFTPMSGFSLTKISPNSALSFSGTLVSGVESSSK